MHRELTITGRNAPELASVNGPGRPPVLAASGLNELTELPASPHDSLLLKTFARMHEQILNNTSLQASLDGASLGSLRFGSSYHCGFSRVVFQLSSNSIGAGRTTDYAIKLGSSHFSEYQVTQSEIEAENKLSQRLAALPQYSQYFAKQLFGASIEIPLSVLDQVHFGMADWVRNAPEEEQGRPVLTVQVCEWINGPTIDDAITNSMLTLEQRRELGAKVVEIIVGAWHATLERGRGIIYDTDLDDIILAQPDSDSTSFSTVRPVFIDADGGKKCGDVNDLSKAIELFVGMFAASRDDKACWAIKAIETAQNRLNTTDLTQFSSSMRSHIQT